MTSITRRELLRGSLLLAPVLLPLPAVAAADLEERFGELEARYGGRLGVAVLDTGGGRLIAHRGDERFPLCSTHKFLSAAFVLARVDRGQESLSRRVTYTRKDVIAYSPVTEKHVGGEGMSIGALCQAAMTLSDNTAANLLFASFGGPAALTAYLRSIGDPVTRLDRREPELNDSAPGDPRDTTTPVAMLEDMHKLVLGTALSPISRQQLTAWLVTCQTGKQRIRAGVPGTWRVGDKTGTGPNDATNDIAVLWPPGRPPILVTAYSLGSSEPDAQRNTLLAQVGRLATAV